MATALAPSEEVDEVNSPLVDHSNVEEGCQKDGSSGAVLKEVPRETISKEDPVGIASEEELVGAVSIEDPVLNRDDGTQEATTKNHQNKVTSLRQISDEDDRDGVEDNQIKEEEPKVENDHQEDEQGDESCESLPDDVQQHPQQPQQEDYAEMLEAQEPPQLQPAAEPGVAAAGEAVPRASSASRNSAQRRRSAAAARSGLGFGAAGLLASVRRSGRRILHPLWAVDATASENGGQQRRRRGFSFSSGNGNGGAKSTLFRDILSITINCQMYHVADL